MAIKPFTSSDGRWHAWQGTAHIMLSDEDSKSLTEHRNVDDVVNFLWRSAAQVVAREFNKHAKG